MSSSTHNIFSIHPEQSFSKIHYVAQSTKDFGLSLLKKLQDIISSLSISQETSQKISQNLLKAKDFLKQNKQVFLGVTLVAGLYVANERRARALRNSKSRHIHSLTSNPNTSLKRSGSQKNQPTQKSQIEQHQKLCQKKSKKSSKPKLQYLRAFISEAEQQEEQYNHSDEQDKQNPDLSASTRRTDSVVSDIECLRKRKKRNLQPILDLVEEEEQTQDRVFFEMFRTYRQS